MLKFFGVKEFAVDGKPGLTEDQRKEMLSLFDEDKVTKFEAYLKDGGEGAESTDIGADIVLGLADKHKKEAADLQAKLDSSNAEKVKLQKLVSDLSAEDEPEPVTTTPLNPALAGKADVPRVRGINTKLGHYEAVNQYIISGRASDIRAAAATINVDNLLDEFGTYLSQNGNNLEEVQALFNGFTSAKYFTSAMAITEWRATQPLITSVSQQFKPKWTPSGQTAFEPLAIRNRRHKINMPIVPSDVLESYMLYMYDERLAVDQMPITKYIWQKLVYPQLMQDVELRMMFKGKYVDAGVVNENDPGTSPEDSMDGLETILVEGLDGSKNINYFDLGSFNILDPGNTDQEVLDFMQNFTGWLAPLFRQMNMAVGCSWEAWRRYRTAYKNKWGVGSGTENTNFGGDKIDFSNNLLVPMDGMYGSPILFTTPAQNLKKLKHQNDVPQVINDVQKVNYEVRLFGEYWLGTGFGFGEGVFAAAPTGYNPKAKITEVYGASTTYQQNKGANPDFTLDTGAGSGSGSSEGGV